MPSADDLAGDQRRIDDLAIASAKALLRRAITLRRDLRSVAEREADDSARLENLLRRTGGRRPGLVAAYLSTGSEPGTLQLVAWLHAHDIPVLLPVISPVAPDTGHRVAWAPYAGPDALRVGPMSILEPTSGIADDALSRAELVICPALAANTLGDRLGRGGGWYDRALSQAAPGAQLWALLNDDEVLEAVPTRPWDRRVGALVTPTRFIDCRLDRRRVVP